MARNYAARSVAVSAAHTALAPFCFMTTNSKCAAREGTGTSAHSGLGSGSSGWGGATSKVGCTGLPRVTAWHPARRSRRPRGSTHARLEQRGRRKHVRILPAPATLRASPSGVGFPPLGTTGSPVCSQRDIGETCTTLTEKHGET